MLSERVRAMLDDVEQNRDEAVRRYARDLDRWERPEFRVSESIKMILMFSLGFIAGFQTPVVVLLLGWAGMIDVAFLRKYRKHALLVIAIVAALLTPADPFSMVMMMVPLCLLYELGALLLKWFPASRVAGGGPKRGDPAIDVALPGREPADAGDP